MKCNCNTIVYLHYRPHEYTFERNTLSTVALRTEVMTGTNELRSSNAPRYNVSKIIIHERFNVSDYLNDIALIQTQSPIEFNERVQPINFTSKAVWPGTLLQTTGWGTLRVILFINYFCEKFANLFDL